MKKRALSLLLVVLMCFSLLPTAAFAAEPETLDEPEPEQLIEQIDTPDEQPEEAAEEQEAALPEIVPDVPEEETVDTQEEMPAADEDAAADEDQEEAAEEGTTNVLEVIVTEESNTETSFKEDTVETGIITLTGDSSLNATYTEALYSLNSTSSGLIDSSKTIILDANGGYFDNDEGLTTKNVYLESFLNFGGSFGVMHNDPKFSFDDWYLDKACTEVATFYDLSDGDTVYAKWDRKVTFLLNANGGQFEDGEVKKIIAVESIYIMANHDVVNKDNSMNFAGWYLDQSCTKSESEYNYESLGLTDDTVIPLYAKWEKQIKIQLNANGGYFDSDEQNTVKTVYISDGLYYWDYYGIDNDDEAMRFDGWCLDPECEQPAYGKDGYYNPTDGEKLYARWIRQNKITFNANGGTFDYYPGDTYVSYTDPNGTIVKIPDPKKDDPHIVCCGWALSSDKGTDLVDFDSFIPDGDTVLYAVWTEAWVVTFHANGGLFSGGESEKTVSVLKGQPLDNSPWLESPGEELYLSGWCTDSSCGGEVIDEKTFISQGDTDLYAKFEPYCSVTYHFNSGYIYIANFKYSEYSVRYRKGEVAETYDGAPYYNGSNLINDDQSLSFTGWYYDEACTQFAFNPKSNFTITENIDLYAKWEKPEEPPSKFVKQCYFVILGRIANEEELSLWTSRLSGGSATAASFLQALIKSAGFSARGLSDEQVVSCLSSLMCSGDPDGGQAAWVDVLSKGVSYDYVIRGFSGMSSFKTLCANTYKVTPGTIALTENRDKNVDVTAFVQRCYTIMMERRGDPGGLNAWTGALLGKVKTGASLVQSFLMSGEFQSKGLSTDEVVEILYNVMLNRASDPGRAGWISAVDEDHMSFLYIINGFSGSQEFTKLCQTYGINPGRVAITEGRDRNRKVTQFVNRCYSEALGREADLGGLNTWCNVIVSGQKTPQGVAAGFVFSAECKSKYPGNEEFVKMLYRLYMGREADEGGLNNWVKVLENGMSRQDAVERFARSGEFQRIVASYGL